MDIMESKDIMSEWVYAAIGHIIDYYIPEKLWFKKVVVNVECYNEESFRWAVARSLDPVDRNFGWITTDLRRRVKKYNWDGVSFPTPLSEIETFEKNNDVLVNVFKWDEPNERAYPIRIPNGKHSPRALLILIDEVKGHYVVIKSMQGLFRKQTGRTGKTFYCNNCLTFFPSDDLLQGHIVCCDSLGYASFERGLGMTPIPKPKPKLKLRPNAGKVNLRAAIDMECGDRDSFKWAVVRSLNPVDRNSGRVTKILVEQSKKYNWDGISFPTPIDQIETFEKNNNILVNVFSFDREGDRVFPISVSTGVYKGRALLVLVDGCYTVVKKISRLLGGQAAEGKKKCERFFCSNCLESFTGKREFDDHISHLCKFAFTPEEKPAIDKFQRLWRLQTCRTYRTFSDDEQEDDFNEYLIRKFNDDS